VRLRLLLFAVVGALAVGQTLAVAADVNPQPIDNSHNAFNAPAPDTSAQFGSAPKVKSGTAFCTTATSTDVNVNTDCAESTVGPHNETSIAVNPKNSLNMIGGANDYQLSLNPDGHLSETILSEAHVTFDGGKTWSMYPVFSDGAYQATGDPALAFDAAGNAYYGTLGFRFVSKGNAQNPDVLVSNSSDGGKTWSVVRVESGSGVASSVGDLLDKEYVAAWGNGNAIVTYGDFLLGQKGNFISARIHASVTHDGGQSWSEPQVISGSLDQAFVATPVRTVDGRIFVSFLNTTDLNTGRDDYEVVEVNPATGAALGAPVKVATTIDGFTDYPIAFGRQTYHDSVFRSWAAGNIAADPTNAAHLAVVWSDMRGSFPPVPSNPYGTFTNSDIIASQSFDHGKTWSAAVEYGQIGDQFMPWSAYDKFGRLRIGYFDRSVDLATNHKYAYTLATENVAGSLNFTAGTISTTNSDPTTGDRWFARNVNPNFPFATAFLGDYANIAVMPDGSVVGYWTDMRNSVTFAGRTGHGEDAYFGTAS
jgi:hypothetical protein